MMANLKASIAIVAICFSLGGCAAPLIVQLASTVGSSISYSKTGKGPIDHVISHIAEQDCKLFRILDGETICVPYEEDEEELAEDGTVLVENDPLSEDTTAVATTENDTALGDTGEPVEDATAVAIAGHDAAPVESEQSMEATTPVVMPPQPNNMPMEKPPTDNRVVEVHMPSQNPSKADKPKLYLVIGSFHQLDIAADQHDRYANFNPIITTAEVNGKRHYRVVVGPHDAKQLRQVRKQLAAAGVTDSWPTKISLSSMRVALAL